MLFRSARLVLVDAPGHVRDPLRGGFDNFSTIKGGSNVVMVQPPLVVRPPCSIPPPHTTAIVQCPTRPHKIQPASPKNQGQLIRYSAHGPPVKRAKPHYHTPSQQTKQFGNPRTRSIYQKSNHRTSSIDPPTHVATKDINASSSSRTSSIDPVV